MERNLLGLQAVEKRSSYVLKQFGSRRHQIRNAVLQSVNMEKRIIAHIHKFRLSTLGILAVENSLHTMTLCSRKLHIILIGKSIAKMRYTVNTVFHWRTISIKEQRRSAYRFYLGHRS